MKAETRTMRLERAGLVGYFVSGEITRDKCRDGICYILFYNMFHFPPVSSSIIA